MARLENKVILITGAAGGQGEAEAHEFVSEGAKVVMTDVAEDEGREPSRLDAFLAGLAPAGLTGQKKKKWGKI